MKTAARGLLACLLALTMTGLFAAAPSDAPAKATVITNSIGMKLALIPAGKFIMGSPVNEEDREERELQHEVAITRPSYMGVLVVTQGEYAQVMPKPSKKAHFHAGNGGSLDHPMENVNWEQVTAFLTKLSELPEEKRAGRAYRLPTEAEWEYACRAGTTTPFHFGTKLSSREANFNGNFPYGGAEKGPYLRKTAKVGSYAPNAFGLYDMHGNVFQWCADWYDKDYYGKSPKEDPRGPDKGVMPTGYMVGDTKIPDFYRVVRGGSWLDDGRACRAAYRYRAMPSDAYMMIGFRVACNVPAKAP